MSGERMQASLAHLGDRAVLVGSVGRAAYLGDAAFVPTQRTGEDRDVDVIDRLGEWQRIYKFSDAAPIDGLMTRRLRPLDGEAGAWGLFTPWHEDGREPLLAVDEDVLGLHDIEMPFPFAQGTRANTVGGCAQMALHELMLAEAGPNLKHRDQVRRIRSDMHDATACHCPALQETMNQYNAFVREASRKGMGEKIYFWGRWALKSSAPQAFKKLQQGTLGQKVRTIRGTPDTQGVLPEIASLI